MTTRALIEEMHIYRFDLGTYSSFDIFSNSFEGFQQKILVNYLAFRVHFGRDANPSQNGRIIKVQAQ